MWIADAFRAVRDLLVGAESLRQDVAHACASMGCTELSGPYLLEIDEGEPLVRHVACGLRPPYSEWWDVALQMKPVRVELTITGGCGPDCPTPCDCDTWAVITVPGAEVAE